MPMLPARGPMRGGVRFCCACCVVHTVCYLIFGELALSTEKKADSFSYSAPCYSNKTRRGLNFIFPVDLRSEEAPAKWTLRGVCLLCSKD